MSVDFSPGEHFVVPDDSSLNFTGGVSVSGWVMLNSVDGRKILSKQAGVSGGGYELGVLNSKFHFEIRTQAGVAVSNQAVSGGTTLSAGVLYFVVGVYDDATDYTACDAAFVFEYETSGTNVSATFIAHTILTANADAILLVDKAAITADVLANVNKDIMMLNTGTQCATGTGTLDVKLTYRVQVTEL